MSPCLTRLGWLETSAAPLAFTSLATPVIQRVSRLKVVDQIAERFRRNPRHLRSVMAASGFSYPSSGQREQRDLVWESDAGESLPLSSISPRDLLHLQSLQSPSCRILATGPWAARLSCGGQHMLGHSVLMALVLTLKEIAQEAPEFGSSRITDEARTSCCMMCFRISPSTQQNQRGISFLRKRTREPVVSGCHTARLIRPPSPSLRD